MSNVLILVGSLRKQGNSRILAESLAEGSKENNDVEIHRNMEKTDVLVIASPVYFYGISSILKAVMGRLHTPLRDTFYIKRTAPLLVAATDIPNLFDSIISQYRMTCDFFDLKDIGIIAVGGVKDTGVIKGNDALDQTYALGKSIV